MPYTPYLQMAIDKKQAVISDVGKRRKITYVAINHAENFDDLEEQVRAEFWAELISRYGYDPKRIRIEFPVPDRTPGDRADIVVFHDDEHKRPYAVIECKRDGVSDAEFTQAVEQAFACGRWQRLSAQYVMVVAGRTRRAFDMNAKYAALEREQNIIADLPLQYGKPVAFKYAYHGTLDIGAVPDYVLTSAIRKCHQTLWGGGRLSPTAAFGELCKIIFVKIRDEMKPRQPGEPYEFQIKTNEPPHKLSDRIKTLYEQHRNDDPEVFSEAIRISDGTLTQVVAHLESINLNATNLDVKGQAFQEFMDGFFKGDFGQYFTPRLLIQFAVEMMTPTHTDIVLDPACGSGGFLLEALDAVRREAQSFFPNEDVRKFNHWHDFAEKRLYGIEINEEIARVAKMNMIIHDDGHTNVVGEDALDRLNQMQARTGNYGFALDRFDLVLTNPPFGASVSKDERAYLGDYELGKTGAGAKQKTRNNQKTEILFVERIWQFLKPGTGRAAVVVPDGILTNASLQYVRDFLLEKFQLLAVVSLPPYAFAHFGAGVKSSLVFLRKRAADETPDDDEPIFMAAPARIGYDATGRKTANDLPNVAAQFRSFEENPSPFFV